MREEFSVPVSPWTSAFESMMDAMADLYLAGATYAEAEQTFKDAWTTHQWKVEEYRKKVAKSKKGMAQ